MTSDVGAAYKVFEWCLLFIDWEPICMPRSEWSGWAQAGGAILALVVAISIPIWQARSAREDASRTARNLAASFVGLLEHLHRQPADNFNIHLALTAESMIAEILLRGASVPVSLLHHMEAHGLQQMLAQARISETNVKLLLKGREQVWTAFHNHLDIELQTARIISSMIHGPTRKKPRP